jgi:pyrimidine-specific ribonucleoside hydrolase
MKALIGLLYIFLVACTSTPVTPAPSPTPFRGEPRSVIIDTDMAHEDMHAILYLLQRPDVRVEAITVSGTGEAHCAAGVRHALGLIALHRDGEIPVACGRETPLVGNQEFPAEWRGAVDNLYGLTLPQSTRGASDMSASELIASVVDSSADKVNIVAVGPLTNVAEALQADADLIGNIEMIYIMGGAVDVPGNVGVSGVGIDNEMAEWNIFVDPHAANIVLESGAPITLVPLDATRDAPVTMSFYKRLEAQRASPEASFVYDLLTANLDFVESGGFQFWDSLTAAIFTDESLATFEMRELTVVEEEGSQSGYTRPTEDGALIRVAMTANGTRFEQMFLEAVNAP